MKNTILIILLFPLLAWHSFAQESFKYNYHDKVYEIVYAGKGTLGESLFYLYGLDQSA